VSDFFGRRTIFTFALVWYSLATLVMAFQSSRHLSRTIMLILFNLMQSVGYYAFVSWIPTLLVSQGITITKSLLYRYRSALLVRLSPHPKSTDACTH
jgi:MFS family permease